MRSQENLSLINGASMRGQRLTGRSLADSEPWNKTVVICGRLKATLSIYLLFYLACCFPDRRPYWGHLNSLNDFLSSASALHDPAE